MFGTHDSKAISKFAIRTKPPTSTEQDLKWKTSSGESLFLKRALFLEQNDFGQ